MNRSITLVAVLTFALFVGPSFAADWPQWRGPGGQGHADASNLPTQLGEDKHVTWKTPIPGRGHSSPVIEGNHIWLTTADDRPGSSAYVEQRLRENTGNQPLIVSTFVSLRAVCVDKRTGELLHNIEVLAVQDPQWVHKLNSYASPTPVIEDGRLYCHFGTLGTACLDTKTGKVLWRNRSLHVMHENGPGSTPVLYKDKLIFHMDGSDKQYIVALDKNTGKVAWQTDRSGELNENPQLRKAYCTPLIVDIQGQPTVVSPAADWLYCYNPDTGKELWKLNYGALGFSNVPRPIVGHGMIYIATSFMRSELLAVRYDGADGVAEPHIVWRYARQVPRMSSPILVGNEIYFTSDTGTFTCLDAKTGDEWFAERLGGNYSASPTYADGHLYLFNREGEATVVKPGRELNIVSTGEFEGGFYASPAIVDNAMFLRTDKALYRVEVQRAR